MLSPRIATFASLAVLALAPASNAFQGPGNRVYVNAAAPAGGDGQSWQTAYSSLTVALMRATTGQHVWVAAGTYKPEQRTVTGDPRSATFWLKNDLRVYGGFAGFETTLAQRAGLFRSTVLDGDIGVPNDPSDNVDHVVNDSGPARRRSSPICASACRSSKAAIRATTQASIPRSSTRRVTSRLTHRRLTPATARSCRRT